MWWQILPRPDRLTYTEAEAHSIISEYLNSASLKADELNTYNRQKFGSYSEIKKQFCNSDFVIFSSALSVEIYFKHIHNDQENLKFLAVSEISVPKTSNLGDNDLKKFCSKPFLDP